MGTWCTNPRIPIYDNNKSCYVSSSKEKATLFNNFFLSHSNIDTENAELPHDETIPESILNNVTATQEEIFDIRIVFCDISKAFDRCWHDGIIYKLKC